MVTFWTHLSSFRQTTIMCPKYAKNWSHFDYIYQPWPLFGHFWTSLGHILDTVFVWTPFGHILAIFWALYGHFLRKCVQKVPIHTFSSSAARPAVLPKPSVCAARAVNSNPDFLQPCLQQHLPLKGT